MRSVLTPAARFDRARVPDFPRWPPLFDARLLRQRWGFAELRAVGDVLRDQFLFMHRCGFDAFEVADEAVGMA